MKVLDVGYGWVEFIKHLTGNYQIEVTGITVSTEQTKLVREKYDDRFYRMWKYYLLSCAGSFRSRKNQLWQIVLSKKGVRRGYQSIR